MPSDHFYTLGEQELKTELGYDAAIAGPGLEAVFVHRFWDNAIRVGTCGDGAAREAHKSVPGLVSALSAVTNACSVGDQADAALAHELFHQLTFYNDGFKDYTDLIHKNNLMYWKLEGGSKISRESRSTNTGGLSDGRLIRLRALTRALRASGP